MTVLEYRLMNLRRKLKEEIHETETRLAMIKQLITFSAKYESIKETRIMEDKP